MGGLKKTERAIFLSIGNGKIVQKFAEDAKGRIKVSNKDGKVHYEERYDELTGIVKSVRYRENSYGGKKWNTLAVRIEDDENNLFQIEVNEDSSYTRDLVGKFITADLSKPVTVRPYYFKRVVNNKEKVNSGITLFDSAGNKIESAFMRSIPQPDGSFKKEYLNGYPVFPDNADEEDIKMYSLNCRKYIKNAIKDRLTPKLEKEAEGYTVEAGDTAPIEDDDLPF